MTCDDGDGGVDTDGDGDIDEITPDSEDTNGVPGELDLMKLVLRTPQPYQPGESVLLYFPEGSIRLWNNPDRTGEIIGVNTGVRSFDLTSGDRTLYVEIVGGAGYYGLTMSYGGQSDYVSVAGITGKQQAALDSIEANVTRIKRSTDLPVAVGFGVRTPEQAAAIARVADGVVVGSALVELIGEHGIEAPEHVRRLTASLAEAVHSATAEAA